MKVKMRETWKAWLGQSAFKKATDVFAICVIMAGIGVSIFMNCVSRSLWLDEAMLADSFSQRSIFELTSEIFERNQSAPVLYLYIVKILTLIFGNTEAVLRSFSVFSYAAVLFLSAYLAKKLFHIRYYLFPAAFLANMGFMLRYSNEFKQYMSEGVWVLLTLLVYDCYKEGKLAWQYMAPLFMIFIWGANPVCFLIGGVLLYEFLYGAYHKDRRCVRNSILTGVGVSISFVTYYFYWLREVALGSSMQNFWKDYAFPLIPRNLEDLKKVCRLSGAILNQFGSAKAFIAVLSLTAIIIGIGVWKNRYVKVIALSLLITLFASYIHMFPMSDRLWCFSYPIFTLLAFYTADMLLASETARGGQNRWLEITASLLMASLVLSENGILTYLDKDKTFHSAEEINFSIAYVKKHVEADEKVFVTDSSEAGMEYTIGYDTDSLNGDGTANIIWSAGVAGDWKSREADMARIAEAGKCYLIAQHWTTRYEERLFPLLQRLRDMGNLEIVMDNFNTPLYYWTKDLQDCKAGASYELLSQEEDGDTCKATVRVTNTGDSFINTDFDDVRLTCRGREDTVTYLTDVLKPGKYVDISLEFDWNGESEVAVQLYNKNRYWYDELGIEPLVIHRLSEGESD